MGNASGWIAFFGTIASTLAAYNMSTMMAEGVMYLGLPEAAVGYIDSLPRMLKKAAKKIFVVMSIVEMIMMFFSNLLILWVLNAIVLQLVIYVNCGNMSANTVSVSFTNALGGAIAASVALLVWQILGIIPILNIISMIEGLPLVGWLVVPLILLIFNLIFGAGVGQAVALSQGCSTTEAFHPYPNIQNNENIDCDNKYEEPIKGYCRDPQRCYDDCKEEIIPLKNMRKFG